jgi:hypothetical protein
MVHGRQYNAHKPVLRFDKAVLRFQYRQFRVSFHKRLRYDDPPLFLIAPFPLIHRVPVEHFCFAWTNVVNLYELSHGGVAKAPPYGPPHVNGAVAISTLDSKPNKRCRTMRIVIVPQLMAVQSASGLSIGAHLASVARRLQGFTSDALPISAL